MPLTTLTANSTARAADVNGNFALCVLIDTARTISVTHTWSASQTFTGGFTTGAAVTLGGNLLFTDATYDIGASGATRPKDFYLSRNAVIGGTLGVTGATTLTGAVTLSVGATVTTGGLTVSAGTTAVQALTATTGVFTGAITASGNYLGGGNIQAGAADAVYWAGLTELRAPSDGVLLLQNAAQTGFTSMQLGGTTSSFPALRRVATGLDVILADASGWAPLESGTHIVNGALTATSGTFSAAVSMTALTATSITASALVSLSRANDDVLVVNRTGTAGNVADFQDDGVSFFALATTGLTSTVGYSGTTGTFSGAVGMTALTATSGTFSGAVTTAALTASGLITASAGLTVASGQTLTVTGATITGFNSASLQIDGGATVQKWLTGTIVWDPGEIAAQSSAVTTTTVSGAAVGDLVLVSNEFLTDNTALVLTAHVSATDTVRLCIANGSSGASNPDSRTIRIFVLQF